MKIRFKSSPSQQKQRANDTDKKVEKCDEIRYSLLLSGTIHSGTWSATGRILPAREVYLID